MVHLTETCNSGLPRPVVHTETTPANVHEAVCTGAIHKVLSEYGPPTTIYNRHSGQSL